MARDSIQVIRTSEVLRVYSSVPSFFQFFHHNEKKIAYSCFGFATAKSLTFYWFFLLCLYWFFLLCLYYCTVKHLSWLLSKRNALSCMRGKKTDYSQKRNVPLFVFLCMFAYLFKAFVADEADSVIQISKSE